MGLELYVFEVQGGAQQLVLKGILNQCSFVSYTEKLNDAGGFKINLAFTDSNRELCKVNRVVWIESDVCGLIERVRIEPSNMTISIMGRMMSCVLSRRALKESLDYSEEPKNIGQVLLDSYESSTEDNALLISSVNISSSLGRTYSEAVNALDLLEVFKNLCTPDNLGFRVAFDSSTLAFSLSVFTGKDRTIGNSYGNSPVVFSRDNDSVESASYEKNIKDQPNTAVVKGEGDVRFLVYKNNTTQTTFSAQEVFLDYSSELQGALSDAEYTKQLTEKAQEHLQKQKDEVTYDPKVNTNTYAYVEDYFLGDTVTAWDKPLGIKESYQITQVTKSFDSSGEKIEPTLGTPQKDLVSILQSLNKRIEEKTKGTERKSESDVLGQIKFTTGKAYYGGEEYILQRGNNRRIIAVSKDDKCSIIDTSFDATEATAEVTAATAILKGLDSKATAEATFNVTQGENIRLFFSLNSTEGAVVDWGDGTTEAVTNYNVSHTYAVSGTVTQKVTAPKAARATIAGESRENVLYIGGEITQVTNSHGYTKMVIWGNKIQQFSRGGWGSSIKYKCDMAFPPGAASLYGSWGNNVNYCYIPAACTTLSSLQSDTFENIEIEASGGELTPSGYYLFGSGGNYIGKIMNSISLPARVKISDKSHLELASGRALRYMRFESGHTTIPSSFMYTANKNNGTNVYSKIYVYIPKTITSIGNSAFASPVHFVYEGTYTEWNAITKDDGFVTNGGIFELSCKNAPSDGGMRYENFESDIKNAGVTSEINAGNGIEIDSNSNTISVALEDDGGLSFASGKLRARAASNNVLGMVKRGSADLSMVSGLLSFLGIKSGHFSSAEVTDRAYSANLDAGFGIKSTDVLVALWERWDNSTTWHGVSVFPFFGSSTSSPRKMWTLKDNTITCPIESMSISTDEGVRVNFYMVSKSEVSPYGYMVNWFIIKKISDT